MTAKVDIEDEPAQCCAEADYSFRTPTRPRELCPGRPRTSLQLHADFDPLAKSDLEQLVRSEPVSEGGLEPPRDCSH